MTVLSWSTSGTLSPSYDVLLLFSCGPSVPAAPQVHLTCLLLAVIPETKRIFSFLHKDNQSTLFFPYYRSNSSVHLNEKMVTHACLVVSNLKRKVVYSIPTNRESRLKITRYL